MGKKDSSCLIVSWDTGLSSLQTQPGATAWVSDLLTSGLELNEPSKFLGLWTQSAATYTLVLLSLQLTACRPWDTSGSVIVKSIPHHISFLYICVCICSTCKIMCVYVLNCFSSVQLCATLWTVACQVPLSMGFSRQEYWSGL